MYQGSPLNNGRFRPNGFAAEELNLLEFRDALTGLSEEHHGAFRDTGDPPFSQPPLPVAEICLRVNEQRWLG